MKNLQMEVCAKQLTDQKNLNNMSQLFAYCQGMSRSQKKNVVRVVLADLQETCQSHISLPITISTKNL